MKRKIHGLIISLLYPALDFVAVTSGIVSSYALYRFLGIGKQVYYEKADIIGVSLLAACISLLILLGFGAYRKESSVLNVEEMRNVIKGLTVSFLLFAVIFVFVKFPPSRYVLVFSYFAALLFAVAERTALYHILPLITSLRYFHKRILIYGAGELGQTLYRSIVNSPKLGIVPVGFIDDDPMKKGAVCYPSGFNCSNGISVLGTGENIRQVKDALDVDEVYVAICNIDHEVLRKTLSFLKQEKIRVSFVPNLYKFVSHNLKIDQIGQIPIAGEIDDVDAAYLRVKRYLDLGLALVSMGVLWPVFLAIAVAIKMDSKGPVLFKHQRIGKDGKVFQIYKFRTMFKDVAPYAVNPLTRNDPRITRVGRFLRKASLDELPQLINVLKGDMSLVGPRPEMPFIASEYNETHRERLKVLPGITGLWQLSGDRKKPIHENMDYDLYYIRNVSFSLDVAILIETVVFALRGI